MSEKGEIAMKAIATKPTEDASTTTNVNTVYHLY